MVLEGDHTLEIATGEENTIITTVGEAARIQDDLTPKMSGVEDVNTAALNLVAALRGLEDDTTDDTRPHATDQVIKGIGMREERLRQKVKVSSSLEGTTSLLREDKRCRDKEIVISLIQGLKAGDQGLLQEAQDKAKGP